jgi:hypothetical protein
LRYSAEAWTREPPSISRSQPSRLPSPFDLGPTFFEDFLQIEKVTSQEREELSNVLGVQLNERECGDLNFIILRFVSAIALSQWLPIWRQYADRLTEIISGLDQLLSLARKFVGLAMLKPGGPESEPGVLSLDASVKLYLNMKGARPSVQIDSSTVRHICIDALEQIKPLVSKRGPRENVNFHLFMESLFHFVKDQGVPTTLPSRQIKEKFGSPHRTPYFKFCRAILGLAITKGKPAIARAQLSDLEKEEALKRLAHSNKDDGGVLEDLHRVREAFARRDRKGSGSRGTTS